ncbi:MAG: hypothetical protein V4628_08125 [Pseudomonadota bacterium]
MNLRRFFATSRVILTSVTLTLAIQTAIAAESAPAPTPRNAEGRALISHAPDQPVGLWFTDYSSRIPFFVVEDIAFRPWAKGLFDERQKHDLEPHARCKASGAIRQHLTPYGVEMLEITALEKLYIFDIGGPHTYREIHMDGRSHPTDLEPTNYGHSIGWWDGDTLVIDSVGYNTDFWFERMGLPHTEDVHITEYYTRRDKNNMDYRFVMTDPTAYEKPVEGNLKLVWREGEELFEYMCQQSNYATDLMVNEDAQAIGKASKIVP